MENKVRKRISQIRNVTGTHRAALEYIDLRDRATHPKGSFDSGGRFYLTEKKFCCSGIRRPSAAYPFSEMLHGRSADHVAAKHAVDAAGVRFIARLIDKEPAYRDPAHFSGETDARNAADAIQRVFDLRLCGHVGQSSPVAVNQPQHTV